jgi:hypothetical protein
MGVHNLPNSGSAGSVVGGDHESSLDVVHVTDLSVGALAGAPSLAH